MIEICANSYKSALAAQQGGAMRVELCANLSEGGTTPSYAQIALSRRDLKIKLYTLIRPRSGDFLYSDMEFDLMKADINVCKSLNCDGIVTGILTTGGEIDIPRCAELVKLAHPMKLTFHRAFDMVRDQFEALETLIGLGFERVLTSGKADKAINAIDVLKRLVEQAGKRIIIMPGAGINEHNLPELIEKTGAAEFHASAKMPVESNMKYRNPNANMGTNANEYQHEQTSVVQVKKLANIVKKYIPNI